MQHPYEWGHQGMILMAKYLDGDKSGIPADGLIIVPGQVIINRMSMPSKPS